MAQRGSTAATKAGSSNRSSAKYQQRIVREVAAHQGSSVRIADRTRPVMAHQGSSVRFGVRGPFSICLLGGGNQHVVENEAVARRTGRRRHGRQALRLRTEAGEQGWSRTKLVQAIRAKRFAKRPPAERKGPARKTSVDEQGDVQLAGHFEQPLEPVACKEGQWWLDHRELAPHHATLTAPPVGEQHQGVTPRCLA